MMMGGFPKLLFRVDFANISNEALKRYMGGSYNQDKLNQLINKSSKIIGVRIGEWSRAFSDLISSTYCELFKDVNILREAADINSELIWNDISGTISLKFFSSYPVNKDRTTG